MSYDITRDMKSQNVLKPRPPSVLSDAVTRRKKPLKAGEMAHLSVAVPADLLIALDEEAKRETEKSLFKVRRSDVVLKALREWLAQRK